MGKGSRGVRIKQMGSKAPKMFNPMDELTIPQDEMINLPPPPDRNYQIFWPMHETFSMDPSQFFVVYPSYLDSNKSISEGRRIGKEKAVDTPTVSDVSQALQSLQIKHVLQPHKGYSRDIETLWDNPGRVKVDPHTSSDFESKRALLVEVASIIPNLPSRQQRLEQEKQQTQLEQAKADEESQRTRQAQKQLQQQQQKVASSKTTNKKKGKKKR